MSVPVAGKTKTVLARAPLIYALAQMRFPEALSLEQSLASLQVTFAQLGLSVFRKATARQINVDNQAAVEIEEIPFWHFEAVNKRSGIVLSRDFISFHTTAYEGFDSLHQSFVAALDSLCKIVSLGAVERCGLRYLNVIRPLQDESVAQYLDQRLLGFDIASIGMQPLRNLTINLAKTSVGTFSLRTGIVAGPIQVVPADLQPMELSLDNPVIAEGEDAAIVDLDHFVEELMPFDRSRVREIFTALHDDIFKTLEAVTKPHAMKVWGKKTVSAE